MYYLKLHHTMPQSCYSYVGPFDTPSLARKHRQVYGPIEATIYRHGSIFLLKDNEDWMTPQEHITYITQRT